MNCLNCHNNINKKKNINNHKVCNKLYDIREEDEIEPQSHQSQQQTKRQQKQQQQLTLEPLSTKTTQVLFFNKDKVDMTFDKENDYYTFIAKEDMETGTLILVEHPLQSKKIENIIGCIIYDQDLSSQLYPRIPKEKFDQAQNDVFLRSKIINDKYSYNVFVFKEKNFVIGNAFSKINHSCNPNCHMSCIDQVENECFYGLRTIKKVKKGEELLIDYAQTWSLENHNYLMTKFNFECNCNEESIKSKKKRLEIIKEISGTFNKKERTEINKLVDCYMRSITYKRVMRHRGYAIYKFSKRVLCVKQ